MRSNRSRLRQTYCLRRPSCLEDWQAYHAIRRKVFNLPRPENDDSPHCHPMILLLDDKPIGAIQIENLRNEAAALRLVAIDPQFQGGGHGRIMLEHAEAFARDLGCRRAVVYATPEAAGFYAGLGYEEEEWDSVCMGGIVQMLKNLS